MATITVNIQRYKRKGGKVTEAMLLRNTAAGCYTSMKELIQMEVEGREITFIRKGKCSVDMFDSFIKRYKEKAAAVLGSCDNGR